MEYEVNDIPAPAEPEPKDPDMASMARWVIGLFFAFLAATIGLTALQHAVQPSENDEARAAAAQFSAPPGLVSSFTKSQFNAEVQGKTKDQVRAEFGKPGLVHDITDEWVYFGLNVRDDTAGTQIEWASIRFEGVDGGTDRAVDVSYQ